MERAMSVEERIRRAENRYNRRNGIYTRNEPKEERTIKKAKKRSIKRLLMQMFVCLLIYVVFYAVTNRNYIFSEEFRNAVGSFVNEKTKLGDWYNSAKEYIQSKFEEESKTENESNKEEEKNNSTENKTNESKESSQNREQKKDEAKESKKDENIGGAIENIEKVSKKKNEKLTEQQIMENEAKEIKENISFIAPIKGRITSTFGWRNPTTSSVPKYHTGVDIAAVEGTKIKAATEGKVIMASSSGDYGKKLYLKEGDTVKQGQEIAEVGSTGNSTGPHLHFEIRKDGRKVDPQLVLDL